MKKILLIVAVLGLIMQLNAQVRVTLGSVTEAQAGTTLTIPLTVYGLDAATGGIAVTAMEFHINYQISSVEYDTTLNFSPVTNPTDWIFGASTTQYGTTWLEPSLLPMSIPDGTVLFDVAFLYKGGQTTLDLDSVRCILLDSDFNPIPVAQVTDGLITPAAGSDQSVWNGNGDWNMAANWSNGVPGINTLALIETGATEVLSNASCKMLTVNTGTSVVVKPGYTLSIAEGIMNNGTFTIESNETGSGSVITGGVTDGSGVYNTYRYIDFGTSASHLLSSPLASATGDLFTGLMPEKYHESDGQWLDFGSGETLQAGNGLKVTSSVSRALLYTGAFNTSDVDIPGLSYTASASSELKGLNLLGNPYPSALELNLDAWAKTNVANGVYVWNGYKYLVWNGQIGSLENGVVPAMQGFLVRASAAGAGLTIPALSRLHSSVPFYKTVATPDNLLVVRFEKQDDPDHSDETFIQIEPGSDAAYSSESDVIKVSGDASFPGVFTHSSDGIGLAINVQPEFSSIPLEFSVPVAGVYVISVTGINSFSNDIPLFIEDKENDDNIFDLRYSPSFPFTFETAGSTGNRFVLHFKTIGISEPDQSGLTVYAWEKNVRIQASLPQKIEQVDVISLTGSVIATYQNLTTPAVIRLKSCSGGIAIIRIRTAKGVFSGKIYLAQ